MCHVEAPEDGPFDLGTTFAPDLVEVGMVPEIGDRSGEATVAIEQRWCMGDGTPAIAVVLGVECEVHPDVLTAVIGSRSPGPWAGNHERCTGRRAEAQRLIDPGVGGLAKSEIIGIDINENKFALARELGCTHTLLATDPKVVVAQSFGECGHVPNATALRGVIWFRWGRRDHRRLPRVLSVRFGPR